MLRITGKSAEMREKGWIRGQRVTVGMMVGEIGAGCSIDELLADFPYSPAMTFLKRYAAWRADAFPRTFGLGCEADILLYAYNSVSLFIRSNLVNRR